MALLNRPAGGGTISGILVTLAAGQGAQLIPAAVPLALVPMAGGRSRTWRRQAAATRPLTNIGACVDRITQCGFALFPA